MKNMSLDKLKTIESKLDNHFKQCEILNYCQEFIIRSSIKCFEDYELQLSKSSDNYYDLVTLLSDGIDALENCVKWSVESNNNTSLQEMEISIDECEKVTCEYFAWAYNYSILESYHIATWRKLTTVEINEEQKLVSFKSLPKELLHFSLCQGMTANESNQEYLKNIPDEEIEGLAELPQSIIDKYASNFEKLIFPELELNFNFDGYTRIDFIKFWTTIYLTFRKYVFIKRAKGFSDSYSYNIDDFYDLFVDIIGRNKVESLLSDLTFDFNNRISLTKNPFIICNDKFLFSPALLTSLDPNQMLVGALNKSSKKYIYDNAINTIEEYWTDKLHEFLKTNKNFEVFYKRSYKSNGKKITPDYVLINPKYKELVIIDYKHFTKPTKVSETINKQVELKKAVEQVNGYLNYFKRTQVVVELNNLNIEDFDIIPVLLFKEPNPISNIDNRVNYLSLWNLQTNFEDQLSFSCLLELIKSRIDNSEIAIENFKTITNEVQMNDWTYTYENLSIPKE